MEKLIWLHAGTGGIALLFGMIALVSKKGGSNHKKSGKVFYYSMLFSAIVALIISLNPDKKNYFLFIIGIFSTYLLLSGFRALKFKKIKSDTNLLIDKMISYGMLTGAIVMIIWSFLPLIKQGNIQIVLLVFGLIGFSLSIRDVRFFKNRTKLKEAWLRIHVGNMVGGYIAAFTAFIVVNQFIPALFGWIGPTLIGSLYITYWMTKLSPKKQNT